MTDPIVVPIYNFLGWSREYQGEIEAKDAVQKRFESIASSIENGDLEMSQHDWSGLKSIFEMIFREAAKL